MPSWSAKRRKTLLATALLSLGLFVACSSKKKSQVFAAPNFELKDIQGKTVSLESFRGSPVLLDFWATWCGPCRLSIPLVQDFYQRHKDKGLVVLGLNMDDDLSGVFSFVQKYHMTYPVLFAGSSTVPADYAVEGIPHFVFIDRQGRVVQVYQGFAPEMVGMWESDLQVALASAPK